MDSINILKFASLTKSVAEFIGLVESLNQKIDKLSMAELNAGVKTLMQANNSVNEKEALLREARNYFNKATFLEKNNRLIIALTGLSLCHFYLGDSLNSKNVYEEIGKAEFDMNFLDSFLVKLKKIEDIKKVDDKLIFLKIFGIILNKVPFFFLPFLMKEWRIAFKESEINNFDNIKQESLAFLTKIIEEDSK